MDSTHNRQNAQKRSDYLLLIQARLYGWHDDGTDETKCCGLPIDQVRLLMDGDTSKFSLPDLTTIARKIGVTIKL